jgi:hypothetical protein
LQGKYLFLPRTSLSWKQYALLAVVLAWATFLVVWRIVVVPLEGSERGRNFTRGDGFSDKNAVSAALYYQDFGLRPTVGLPVHMYRGDGNREGTSVYTHYPSLPDLFTGFSAWIFSTRDARVMRILPLLLSLLLAWVQFAVLSRWIKQSGPLVLSLCLLWLSNYHIAWADNLHKHLLEEFGKWGMLALLGLWHHKPRNWILGCTFLLGILLANVSFEPVVYVGVLALGLRWVYGDSWKRTVTSPAVWWPALGLILGVLLHLFQNALYFGSFDAAWHDMVNAAAMRTTGSGPLPNELGRQLTMLDVLSFPLQWLNRIERFFLLTGWALLAMSIPLMTVWRKSETALYSLVLVLSVASIAWWFVMPQHALVHTFTTRHFGIFFSFLAGPALWHYAQRVKVDFASKRFAFIVVHIGFIGYMLAMAATQQIWDLWFRYGLLYPHFGK